LKRWVEDVEEEGRKVGNWKEEKDTLSKLFNSINLKNFLLWFNLLNHFNMTSMSRVSTWSLMYKSR